MRLQVFKPLTDNTDLQTQKICDIVDIVSYTYHKKFYDVGSFEIVIARKVKNTKYLDIGQILLADGQDWLIINNIIKDYERITISGTDLKGLLANRIALYSDTQYVGTNGYDVAAGTTDECVKYYVSKNLGENAEENRRIPRFICAENNNNGIEKDSYMARFDIISELVTAMCKNADIGYEVTIDKSSSNIIFDTVNPTNHSISQNENEWIVFDTDRKNIMSIQHEYGNSELKNIMYATTNSDVTMAICTTDPQPPAWQRKEINVAVSTDTVADIELYAKREAENYLETNSFSAEISGTSYGERYKLGDFVTVRSKEFGVTLDTQLLEVEKICTDTENKVNFTFGEKKPKLLNKIIRRLQNDIKTI